jgi:ABC-2 type transport system permease protein
MLRKILLIAKRDYVASVMRPAFLIGLVVAPLMMGGVFFAMALMRASQTGQEQRIAVIDHTGLAAKDIIEAAEERNKIDPTAKAAQSLVGFKYVFEVVPADEQDPQGQRLTLSDRVRSGELFMFADIGADVLRPTGTETSNAKVTLFASGSGVDDTRAWLIEAMNTGLRRVRLRQAGLEAEAVQQTLAPVRVERLGLTRRDETSGAIQAAKPRNELEGFAVPLAMMMLMFMIVMGSAAPMLGAIAEDKMQRVFEMLLATTTPFELMMGKVLAAVGRSLTSSVFYVIGAVLGLQGAALLGLVPFHLLPWFFVYVLAEVTMLSALGAGLGAATSAPRDAQSFAILLTMPVMIPLFLIIPLVQNPNGQLAVTLSFIPPLTPMVMLLRQSMPGGVPVWQPWLGLVGVILCTLMVTWAAARIFRVTILMQGKPPRLPDLVRWAIRG